MVDVSSWSETPASNTTIDSIDVAESCNPGNLNNAIRSLMAGVKTFHVAYSGTVSSLSGYAPLTGAVFTGTQPKYTGEGAMLHNQGSGYSSGKIFVQAAGGSAPSMASGDWLAEY